MFTFEYCGKTVTARVPPFSRTVGAEGEGRSQISIHWACGSLPEQVEREYMRKREREIESESKKRERARERQRESENLLAVFPGYQRSKYRYRRKSFFWTCLVSVDYSVRSRRRVCLLRGFPHTPDSGILRTPLQGGGDEVRQGGGEAR